MTTQSEYALEEALITQLKGMEYSTVRIEHEAEMLANLKRQLEIHNQITPLASLNLSMFLITSIPALYLSGRKYCAISSL